ncbi:MAG: hypothetical protein LBI10_09035 [Deltaproteobacteria bacterium]|nr:hypothetical protein [Deltaproteobacteria bacterium]
MGFRDQMVFWRATSSSIKVRSLLAINSSPESGFWSVKGFCKETDFSKEIGLSEATDFREATRFFKDTAIFFDRSFSD